MINLLEFLIILVLMLLPDIFLRLDPLLGGYYSKYISKAREEVSTVNKLLVSHIPYLSFYGVQGFSRTHAVLWDGIVVPFLEELLFYGLPFMINPYLVWVSSIVWGIPHASYHITPYRRATTSKFLLWSFTQLIGWLCNGLAIAYLWFTSRWYLAMMLHIIIDTVIALRETAPIKKVSIKPVESPYFSHQKYLTYTDSVTYIFSNTSWRDWMYGKKVEKPKATNSKKEKEEKEVRYF